MVMRGLRQASRSRYVRRQARLQQDHVIAAAYRIKLCAPHYTIGADAKCPGCKLQLTAKTLVPHVLGCTLIKGFNSSSRHSELKNAMQSILRTCSIRFDSKEPREFGTYKCSSTGDEISFEGFHLHKSACGTCRSVTPHFSGPDLRVFFSDGSSMVIDFTILSVASVTRVRDSISLDEAFAIAEKEKENNYGADVAAGNELFVTMAFSATGSPSNETCRIVSLIANRSEGAMTYHEILAILKANVMFQSAKVLINAESHLTAAVSLKDTRRPAKLPHLSPQENPALHVSSPPHSAARSRSSESNSSLHELFHVIAAPPADEILHAPEPSSPVAAADNSPRSSDPVNGSPVESSRQLSVSNDVAPNEPDHTVVQVPLSPERARAPRQDPLQDIIGAACATVAPYIFGYTYHRQTSPAAAASQLAADDVPCLTLLCVICSALYHWHVLGQLHWLPGKIADAALKMHPAGPVYRARRNRVEGI